MAVREALPDAREDIAVLVHAGVHRLRETLLLTERDSGREGVAVTWRSADGPGRARIAGSLPLTGWQRGDGRIWITRLPEGCAPETLYEGGRRLRKARHPDYRHDSERPAAAGTYLTSLAGSDKLPQGVATSWIEYAPQEAPPAALSSAAHLKIGIFPWGYCDWHRWTCRVTGIDREKRRIEFDSMGDRTEILAHARYFLEDALLFLDQPGEFFVDRDTQTLYCIPCGDGHPDTLAITAPLLTTLIEIRGAARDRPVRNLRFEGLTFEESDALSPSLFWWRHAWGRDDHALLKLRNTSGVTLRDCRFVNSGRHGILMVGHNTGNTVYGCLIEQIGISGITLSNRFAPPAGTAADRLENTLISNSRIRHVGQLGLYASCIELMNTSGNEVSHCELSHSPRYAVTLRGNTGNQHGPPVTTAMPPSVNNHLHHLRIFKCGQDSGDMGALHAANLNNPGGGCTNTFEQITIADTCAIEGMADIEPDGIFLDWPRMAMDQIFRDVQVVRAQGRQFRSNGPDNEASAVTENVSWKPGFDESRMRYAAIGLLPDFPAAFGAPPAVPAQTGAPRTLRIDRVAHNRVALRWKAPRGAAVSAALVYTLYRDGQMLGSTRATTFIDSEAQPGETHRYSVAAADGDFAPRSPESNALCVPIPRIIDPLPIAALFTERGLLQRLFAALRRSPPSEALFSVNSAGIARGGVSHEALTGIDGGALIFNGRDGSIEADRDINLGDGDFTLSAWIWKKRPGSRVVMAKGDGFRSGQWSWGWEHPPKSGSICFRAGNRYFASAPHALPTLRWTHVAFVRQGTTGRCYIDGEPSGEPHAMTSLETLSNDLPLLLGRRAYEQSPAWFYGKIAAPRIDAHALTPQEIKNLAHNRPR